MKKRFLATLLALCMILTVLPATAAADNEGTSGGTAADTGTDIGDTETPGGSGEDTAEGEDTENPENPDEGEDKENPENPDGGEDKENPENPDEGEDKENPENPDGGEDKENPENPGEGEDKENPENPDEGEDKENPENPDEGEDKENPENPDEGEDKENPENPDEGEDKENPEDPAPLPFTDVAEDAWYHDEVRFVFEKGMMLGDGSPTIFNPNGATTRGMIVTILYRLEGEPETTPSTFDDVESGKWYADAAAWAAANGIVNGVGNNKFQPEGAITRQDFATILHRYAGFKGHDVDGRANLDSYADAGSVRSYALEAMQWAVDQGLIAGSYGLLDPSGSAVRAQSAAILARFCEKLG